MRISFAKLVLAACLSAVALAAASAPATDGVARREEFDDLAGWQPFNARGKQPTLYAIASEGDACFLRAASDGSCTALIDSAVVDVNRHPVLRWRWKVDNVYQQGDATDKHREDFPLRVAVLFEDEKTSLARRLKQKVVSLFYGHAPPHSALFYVWANREQGQRILKSPVHDVMMLVVLRQGPAECGLWLEEEVNVLEDYRAAFGGDPPPHGRLAVWGDADNTGESAVAYLDWLELSAR